MITNPVEYMSCLWVAHGGAERDRILGLGLSLDAARAAPAVAHACRAHAARLVALGTHGPDAHLAELASEVGGVPLLVAARAARIDHAPIVRRGDRRAVQRVRHHGHTTYEPARVFVADLDRLLRGKPVNASGFGAGPRYAGLDLPLGGLFRLERGRLAARDVQRTLADERRSRAAATRLLAVIRKHPTLERDLARLRAEAGE
jgi:hypothetical protein